MKVVYKAAAENNCLVFHVGVGLYETYMILVYRNCSGTNKALQNDYKIS